MIGQTISHYRILEKLGEGGMGVVYKAEDVKLKRTVALKFLPPELTRDKSAKTRFVHEAQVASALQHHNICTIHEIDETRDGRLFIVMDCYDGESLKEKISEGPLSVEESVEIASQVAAGLSKAHEAGMVHRDIKPANIMVTKDGIVKLLDFGLAKLAGMTKVTKTGTTVGTVAYMSPEQAKGEKVDARTDTWSLGVMLFEMLAGQLPFMADHEPALLYCIVHENPHAISSVRHGVPPRLSSVISKALQKDPALRFQSARELLVELESITLRGVTVSRQEKSIVVLPFENLSPDPGEDYFSDGLTDEVISDLSNVNALRVISRSSAMTFKGTKKKLPEIARELDVQYVLEGSVRKAGQSLRITAQLIDAANDAHLWADKYTGTMEDVFDVQEKVSRSIVEALKLKLSPEESRKIGERQIDDVVAYQWYLRANAAINRFDVKSLESARVNVLQGLEVHGDNALLYGTLAFVYWQYVNLGLAQDEYIAKAEEYANKALDLDPDSPQAHFVLGMIQSAFYGETVEFVRRVKKTLSVDPNHRDALRFLSSFSIFSCGKPASAVPLLQKLRQIDPLDPINHGLQGIFYFCEARYKAALEQFRQYYEADPDNALWRYWYALALSYENDLAKAFAIIDHAARTAPDNVCTRLGLLLKYGLQNQKDAALKLITPTFESTCRRDDHWSYFVALGLALAKATDESLDWLENAANRNFMNYPELKQNRYLNSLRGEERFEKLLIRVKREWERFEI